MKSKRISLKFIKQRLGLRIFSTERTFSKAEILKSVRTDFTAKYGLFSIDIFSQELLKSAMINLLI